MADWLVLRYSVHSLIVSTPTFLRVLAAQCVHPLRWKVGE